MHNKIGSTNMLQAVRPLVAPTQLFGGLLLIFNLGPLWVLYFSRDLPAIPTLNLQVLVHHHLCYR